MSLLKAISLAVRATVKTAILPVVATKDIITGDLFFDHFNETDTEGMTKSMLRDVNEAIRQIAEDD